MSSTPFEFFKGAHENSDVDNEPSAQHHTLGKGPMQAAPGNHSHTTYSDSGHPPPRPIQGDEWVVTDMQNLRRRYENNQWTDKLIGTQAMERIIADIVATATSGQRIEIKKDTNIGGGVPDQTGIKFYSGDAYENYPAEVYYYSQNANTAGGYGKLELTSGGRQGSAADASLELTSRSSNGAVSSAATLMGDSISIIANSLSLSGAGRYNDPPIGTVIMYAGGTLNVPDGWLNCNGGLYYVSDYPTLGNLLLGYYGGNGSTTFCVPDMQSRYPVGVGQTSLGQTDGTASVSARWDRMNHDHNHSIPAAEQSSGSYFATATSGSKTPYLATYNGHVHGGATGNNGNNGYYNHAYTTLNFLIKALK